VSIEQAGGKPESLVHDVTRLPRHAPAWGATLLLSLGAKLFTEDELARSRGRELRRGIVRPRGGL